MEDYRLEQSGQQVQDILNGAAMQVDLTSEVERATEAENILDGKIDAEEERAKVAEKANADDIDAIEEKIPSGASSSNKLATSSDVNDEAQARSDADQTINDKIDTIEAKIPTGASSENKLATEEYVDDSVATNTATFRGTYNLVSDLGLLPSATHEQIAYALGGEIATVDNNDYCFVQIPTSSETPTQITKIERYKFNGDAWAFEYTLNNSGFTAAQWAAINSGITSGDVTKLSALPTNAELTTLLNGKQDTLTFDNAPTENSNNPVKSGGVYSGIKAEEERAKAAEKANADDIDAIEEKIPSGASSSNKLATASDVTGEAAARENADASLQQAIEAILLLIPSAATSLNQLADKAFVNSSIATNTATFRGTFNSVSDLHLSISATHEQIGTMLASSIATADNNDYAFVQIPTSAHRPTEIARTERYKFNGITWEYEYDLNNSGYTTAQWAAINSTITQELVTKLSALPNNDDLTTALSVLTDSISAINAKIPSAASSDNKLVDTTAMQTYIAQLLDVLDANYNVTSTDGHVTVQITQTNGKVTDFAVTTSDIASAADLELIAGRVTTAEGNISTNAEDIAQLQAAYAALTQNDLVIIQPTDTWPVANPAENIIYRFVDRVNTPPEYYSDYMWNGTTMVLMAQYNNAIDPRPKKGSTNLVESGGVFNNMGALDVSELNATENPHTLATYADLSAALAAIPSDYQKGGMSIKFVQSSDNKYVQYFLTKDEWSATVSDWQGVDDEPIAGSDNIVKSGGIVSYVGINELINKPSADNFDATSYLEVGKSYVFKTTGTSGVTFRIIARVGSEWVFVWGSSTSLSDSEWHNITIPDSSTMILITGNYVGDIRFMSGVFKDVETNNKNIQENTNDINFINDYNKQSIDVLIAKTESNLSCGNYLIPGYTYRWRTLLASMETLKLTYYNGTSWTTIWGETDGRADGQWREFTYPSDAVLLYFQRNYVGQIEIISGYFIDVQDNTVALTEKASISSLESVKKSKVTSKIGKNLFNENDENVIKNARISGADGTITADANNNVQVTGYIEVEEGKTYTISNPQTLSAGAKILPYTADLTSVGVASVNANVKSYTVPTGKNIKYVRFTICNSKYNQIEEGSVQTVYEPYTELANYDINPNTEKYENNYKDVIFCDGDSITWGALSGTVQAENNYPSVLQKHLGQRFKVVNCGIPGISSASLLGNATGYRILEDFTIPADQASVDFTCCPFRQMGDISDSQYLPKFSSDASGNWIEGQINPVVINGVEGSILPLTVGGVRKVRFTRFINGDVVSVKAGDIMFTNEVGSYNKATHLIFIGVNYGWIIDDSHGWGDSVNIEELIGQYKDIIRTSSDLYICMTSYSNSWKNWGGKSRFAEEFGDHYIDLCVYLNTNAATAIQDAIDRGYLPDDGTYPTAADLEAISQGICPPTLTYDGTHLTDVGYHLLGDLVFDKYQELYKKKVLGQLV